MGARQRAKSDFLLLIVDDDKDFLASMSFWFKTQGYRVMTAPSGEQALNILKEKTPSIVFLDYMMPGLDGIQTLQRIRKDFPRLPVVMLSAYAHENMRVEAYKLGANGVFDKSVNFYNAENLLNSLVRIMARERPGFTLGKGRKGWWVVLSILVLSGLLGGVFFAKTARPQVCFGDVCVTVEVADTEDKRTQGLMFRSRLPEGRGMLFVFPESAFWPFWMKDTYMSLDIFWLNENREVVELIRGAQPAAGQLYPPRFGGTVPARFALEVPAGFAERHGVKEGVRARFKWIFFKR